MRATVGKRALALASALLLLAGWVLVGRVDSTPATASATAVELRVSHLSADAVREAWRAQLKTEPAPQEVEGVLEEAREMLAPPASPILALFARSPPRVHAAGARAAAPPALAQHAPLQPFSHFPRPIPAARTGRRTATAKSCICVNCKWVKQCTAYHFVEERHEVPHLNDAPKFEPVNTSIQVFLRTEEERGQTYQTQEFDVFECDSFFLEQGAWQRLRPGEEIPT